MPPYQQRVVDELRDLSDRHGKLVVFIVENPAFGTLPAGERCLLWKQSQIMCEYERVLQERISNFPA